MDETDIRMIEKIKRIVARGNNVEVKYTKDKTWVIYEVEKRKVKVE